MKSKIKFILRASFAAVLSLFVVVTIIACSSDSDENGVPPPILYPETGAWNVPELIDTIDTGSSSSPLIATDYNGNAIAVWHRSDGTYNNIWANHYTANLGWGEAQLIENNDNSSHYPDIGIDNYGNAIVVWDDSINIWATRYEPYTGWSTPIIISLNGSYATRPDLSVNPSGDAIVVWVVNSGESAGIWSNRYTIYEGWKEPEMIGVDGYGPSVANDHFGNGLTVWTQWRLEPTTGIDVWANYYIASAGWTGPVLISSGDSKETDPKIAFDSVGNAMLVSRSGGWGCYDTWMFGTVCGSQSVILARQYTKGDGWSSAQALISSTTNNDDSRQPQIAMDSNGNSIAVWSQGAYLFGYHLQDAIYASRFTPESGWSIPERIAQYLAGSDAPQISFDANGNAMAVWSDRDGRHGLHAIVANQYIVGQGWGEATHVEEMYSGSVGSPHIAIDSLGGAVVVWPYDESYTDQWNIWANRFELN